METSAYKVYFDAELNCVIMEWNGYSTSVEFRQGTEFMLNTLIANRANFALADIKNMVLIGKEDQDWLETAFLPRAMTFGFSGLAVVRPSSYFNKVAIESISCKIDKDKFAINLFDNVDEAKGWLKSIIDGKNSSSVSAAS